MSAYRAAYTVAFDVDPACVERHSLDLSAAADSDILPLRVDLTNPSPALGWDHRERPSLIERAESIPESERTLHLMRARPG